MNSRLYTNTSNVKGVVGLVVTTVLVSYAATNATKIVDDTKMLAKKGLAKVKTALHHNGKRQYILCGLDIDGKPYDTGLRVWR